jgi:PEP-CTERM motif
MRRATAILSALDSLIGVVERTNAGTIAGPTSWTVTGAGDTYWGIQFTALQDSTLTSFDYNHRGTSNGSSLFYGIIFLIYITTNTTVYTSNYGTGLASVVPFTGLGIARHSGDVYQLVATSNVQFGTNDELFQYLFANNIVLAYPTSDSDISVTQGALSTGGFENTHAWGAFNNITTASAVPEPGTLGLLGIGALGLIGYVRRHRSA